jgi:hypothetical protein
MGKSAPPAHGSNMGAPRGLRVASSKDKRVAKLEWSVILEAEKRYMQVPGPTDRVMPRTYLICHVHVDLPLDK